jgi:hypothetical protein
MTDTELLATLVAELHGIRMAVEAMASVQAPAPNIMRQMADWKKAREILESMGAEVVSSDKSGPTRAQYQGRIYVRRSAHDEDGERSDAIWFSTVLGGNVKEGNVKWGRLLTFRDRKTDMLPNGAKKLKVDAPEPKQVAGRNPQDATPVDKPSLVPVSGQLTTPTQAKTAQARPEHPARPAAKRVWTGEYVQLVLRSGLVATGQGAADLLNKSKLSPRDTEEVLIRWLGKYRSALSDDNDPEQALFVADTVLPQASREGGTNGAR